MLEKRYLFRQCSHTFGKTALALSGGGNIGWFHMGLMKVLFDEGYLPSVFSGSSAGAMMSCMIGTRTDEELHEVLNYESLSENLLRDEKVSLWKMVLKFWKDGDGNPLSPNQKRTYAKHGDGQLLEI